MSNTYTQIHLQFVFAVKYRAAVIEKSWKDELHKYMTGIIQGNNHKVITINSVADHAHILVGMRPNQSVSDLLQDIKADSSKWINNKGFTKQNFNWQDGYGAFSYSKSQLPRVINYINNQEVHHQKLSFIDEYKYFLKEFEIEFDEKYIFRELI